MVLHPSLWSVVCPHYADPLRLTPQGRSEAVYLTSAWHVAWLAYFQDNRRLREQPLDLSPHLYSAIATGLSLVHEIASDGPSHRSYYCGL
jgi:outer membrane biogenesis lipoprotein LolB